MTLYAPAAMERAMKIQEMILRAMSGEIKWVKATGKITVTWLRAMPSAHDKNDQVLD
ncbi:MAG: hypothetical protein JRI34_01220 [Deltaproteobacteria bacterium]|nr:hypothetical protein [Deltaproteobacteria bacterium]